MARPRPHFQASPLRLGSTGALPTHDASGQPMIRLQTLGAAVLMVGDLRLSAAAGTLFSVLVRLSGTPGMMLSREVLRRSLWPDQEEVRQRANLRQALYKLRGFGVRVTMHGDVVLLDETQVLRSFSRERTAETFERDVTLGHEPFGPFLPGFAVPWPEFQEWIDVQREAVHADVRRVLIDQLRRRRERADWGGADALARWLLQFDPLNEEATLTVAECTALSGSKTEALAILDRYLAELGPAAGDIRLPATMLRKRIAEPASRGRLSFAPTERHFVGRDAELASLTLSMRRARWHDGSAVLLHGPPGIGKSRLGHELDKVATIEGIRVVQTSCRESDLLRPLSVFLDVLPELMSHAGALGCAPESLAALRRLVPAERWSGDPPGDATAPRAPMPMAASLRRSIIDLLSAVSDERPLLLIVEDVHWIDEHSWDVLADLIDRASAMRVFLLMTSREPHARPQRPQRVPLGLDVHRVPPLSSDSCLLLSRAIGDDLAATITDDLGEWFVRASEGIPLFLRALVSHWIETGEAGGVPPTLQGVIEQRLSQLTGDALRVLQTAALLGKWATCERVALVLQQSASTTIGNISELESNGMLVSTVSLCLACHELISASASLKLQCLAKAALHSRIAAVFEIELEEKSNTAMLLTALRHLEAAGEYGTLVRLSAKWTSNLDSCSEPAETLRFLESVESGAFTEQARCIYNDTCSRLRVASGLYGEELLARGGLLQLPRADHTMTAPDAESALSLVESIYRADSGTDRDQLADYVVTVASHSRLPHSVRVRAAGIGFVILSNQCDLERANTLWRALSASRSLNSDSIEVTRVALIYHTIFGDRDQADTLARYLLRRALGDQRLLSAPTDALKAGFALRMVSRSSDYFQAFELAFRSAESLALPAIALNAVWQLAQCHLELGNLEEHGRWAVELERRYQENSGGLSTSFAPALLCRGAIERSDTQMAIEYYAQYVAVTPERPTVRTASHTLALEVAIGLLDANWIPQPSQIASLIAYADRILQFGTSDFFASVAVQAIARKDKVEATALFIRYVRDLRREFAPWSVRLRRTADSLDVSTAS